MEKDLLISIGYYIAGKEGRDFDYFDEEEDLYIFYFHSFDERKEYVEYVEIPKKEILQYKETSWQFHDVAI